MPASTRRSAPAEAPGHSQVVKANRLPGCVSRWRRWSLGCDLTGRGSAERQLPGQAGTAFATRLGSARRRGGDPQFGREFSQAHDVEPIPPRRHRPVSASPGRRRHGADGSARTRRPAVTPSTPRRRRPPQPPTAAGRQSARPMFPPLAGEGDRGGEPVAERMRPHDDGQHPHPAAPARPARNQLARGTGRRATGQGQAGADPARRAQSGWLASSATPTPARCAAPGGVGIAARLQPGDIRRHRGSAVDNLCLPSALLVRVGPGAVSAAQLVRAMAR